MISEKFKVMIAKNNIFNIRIGASWKGMTGARKGFVEFESEEYALRAWMILMRTYRRKYGLKTIRSIVRRFAPESENNTEQYIRFVSMHSMIGRDVELRSMDDYRKLAMAMARMETGTILTERLWTEVVEKYQIQIV